MTITPENPIVIPLPERLNAAAAAPLKVMLDVDHHRAVQLDASDTINVSAQVIQVLISAHQSSIKSGTTFIIEKHSRELVQTLELLGIAPRMVGIQETQNGS